MKESKLFVMVSSWIARIRQGELTSTDMVSICTDIPKLSLEDINIIEGSLSNAITRMRPKCDTYSNVVCLLNRQRTVLEQLAEDERRAAKVKVHVAPVEPVEEPTLAPEPVQDCNNVKEVIKTFVNMFNSTQNYNPTCVLFLAQDETASGLVCTCHMRLDGERSIRYTSGDLYAFYRDEFIYQRSGDQTLLNPSSDFGNKSKYTDQAIAAIEWHLNQAEYLELSSKDDIESVRDSVKNASDILNSIATQSRDGYVIITMQWIDNNLVVETSDTRLCIKRQHRF